MKQRHLHVNSRKKKQKNSDFNTLPITEMWPKRKSKQKIDLCKCIESKSKAPYNYQYLLC